MQTTERAYMTLSVVLLLGCGEAAANSPVVGDLPPCTSETRFRMSESSGLTTYTYDAERREIGRETRSSAGLVTGRATTEYDAAGFVTRAHAENATEPGATTLDHVVETIWVYTPDHRGYVAERTENDVVAERERATLNAAGEPEMITFEIGGGVTTFRYNASGLLIERTTTFDDGASPSTTTFTYRTDGLVEREVEVVGSGAERITVYTYVDGLRVRKSRLVSNGTDEEVWTEYVHDDARRLIQETTYVPAVDPSNFNMQTEYTYECWDEE